MPAQGRPLDAHKNVAGAPQSIGGRPAAAQPTAAHYH
ncbi:unnamed protein product [Mycena citricolor]|uniref:Uncharacterized protein n=1 Tax=Mycena citricolor TaxID=2018698 RepID=A0AAD2JWI2_9AGAR|nr:unnamed protein product [Mycena citricolor]